MLDRKQFWSECWGDLSESMNSVDSPYCKSFHLDNKNLDDINNIVFDIIYNSMNEQEKKLIASSRDYDGIIKYLSGTKVFAIDVANQMDTFTKLESAILSVFRSRHFLNSVSAIQFPVDIRVVHAVPPPNYLEKRKAVDFLHTDAWRGEPPDVVNCVLYCAVSDKASQLVVYDVPKDGIDVFESYAGPEKEASALVKHLSEVKFDHIPGEAIFFDAYSPHNTKRNGDEVRISLNFSFRRGDPYEILDERWDRAEQPWGKYWYLPQSSVRTLKDRCEQELEKLAQSGQSEALAWREKVIDKLSIPRKLEELYA